MRFRFLAWLAVYFAVAFSLQLTFLPEDASSLTYWPTLVATIAVAWAVAYAVVKVLTDD